MNKFFQTIGAISVIIVALIVLVKIFGICTEFARVQSRVTELEGQNQELAQTLNRKNIEINDLKQKNGDLEREIQQYRDVVNQVSREAGTYKQQLVTVTAENIVLQNANTQLARHNQELARTVNEAQARQTTQEPKPANQASLLIVGIIALLVFSITGAAVAYRPTFRKIMGGHYPVWMTREQIRDYVQYRRSVQRKH